MVSKGCLTGGPLFLIQVSRNAGRELRASGYELNVLLEARGSQLVADEMVLFLKKRKSDKSEET